MITFIILHYLTEDMTIQCVETVRNTFKQIKYRIVIVDNASGNGSGERIKEKYKKCENIVVLINEKNMGFANGNNRGWKYMREHWQTDFAIVMNNDVLIEDAEFIDKINYLYAESRFDILGPDIYVVRDGRHQNPARLSGMTKEDISAMIKQYEKRLRTPIFYHYVVGGLWRILCTIKNTNEHSQNEEWRRDVLENPVLHGACYIVSKNFIENEMMIFNPDTFMYCEEDILYYYCMAAGYKMIYSSKIQVKHLASITTRSKYKSDYKRDIFCMSEQIKSAKVLLRIVEKYNEEKD